MGLKSIRIIVFDSDFDVLASCSKPITTALNGLKVTQEPNEWLSVANDLFSKTFVDIDPESIDCITVSASSSCLVCSDNSGNSLFEAIMVSDKRATQEAEDISCSHSFEDVKKKTGLGCDPYLMLPKILWVKRNKPEIFAKTAYFLSPNDFLIAHLTNNFVTDVFNAAKYHYLLDSSSYPLALLKELGISPKTLPEVKFPGEIAGVISPSLQKKYGFRPDCKVVLSTYDALCAFFGSGPSEEGDACDVSGTVTSLRALSYKDPSLFKPNNVFLSKFPPFGISVLGGSNNLGGGLIEWAKQCFYPQGEFSYEIMEEEAKSSSIGAKGLIFLPYLMGERAPLWDSNARGVLFGLERQHTRADIIRAVFESTGYSLRNLVDSIERSGLPIKRLLVSGGLARIGFISQLKADITNKPVYVVDNFETTAVGAAILAMIGSGDIPSFREASSKLHVQTIILPNPKNVEKYNQLYRLFGDVYTSLKGTFTERSEICSSLSRETTKVIENL